MKKGITIVFLANVFNLLFSVVTNFILPKYLSIESYGYYKIFQLYINYLGILHLGFVDGIYLQYGGKNIKLINENEILNSSATLRNMQLIISIAGIIMSFVFKNPIMFFLALSCIPINMISYYKSLYQATGQFKEYGIVLTVLPLFIFIGNFILLLCFRTDNYIAYIIITFVSNLILFVYLEYKNSKMFGQPKLFVFRFNILKENIKSGITLTIGNFASILLTSIDRWFIQAWMTISDFSYYSFAVSVENLFNVCVSAITTTLYNYLCKVTEIPKIIRIKVYCIFIGVYLVALAFPVKLIVQVWLDKYLPSLFCFFILICAHSFYFVIKSIYVNLYKARGQQKHYFYQMLVVLVIAVITNIVAYVFVSQTKESFAGATLLTAIIWYFICYGEFKELRGKRRETIFLFVCTIIYLICGIGVNNAIIGCFVYIFGVSILAFFLCREFFVDFIVAFWGYINNMIKNVKGGKS